MLINNLARVDCGKTGRVKKKVFGTTIKDSINARIGEEHVYEEQDNLVIEGVLCEEMTLEDCLFIQKFVKLEYFAFNDNRLSSLKRLPLLENLKHLELNYNKIKTGLEALNVFKQL